MIPIAHIQHFSLSDFPGTPSCIVFTQGCNLACRYCHNKQLIPLKSSTFPWDDEDFVFDFLKERAGKLEGLVLTGGEPLYHGLNVLDFLEQVKELGYKVKLDTNGTFDIQLEWMLQDRVVDYIALDIKAPWDKYDQITKVRTYDVDKVKASLDILKRRKVPFEIRTTFDKEVLTDEDIKVISGYAPGVLHRVNECMYRSDQN